MSTVKKRVLVVEDDHVLRMLFEDALRPYVAVDTAPNGVEALEKTSRVEYAVIILDLVMPLMNGITFLREFRVRHAHARTKIIATTAAGRTLGLKPTDVDAFFAKPFDLPTVIHTVREYVSRASEVPTPAADRLRP